jgi:hypothetical protein
MIEITEKYVDGVRFIDKMRVLDMDERRFGIPVHYVDDLLGKQDGVAMFLRTHGLSKVGEAIERRADIYVSGPIDPILYWLGERFFRWYWKAVRWSYNNLRVFKQIPPGYMFSWRYFTPYVWFKGLPK